MIQVENTVALSKRALESGASSLREADVCDEAVELLAARDLDGARALLERVADADSNARVLGLLGTCYLLLERYAEAEAKLTEAIELDAKNESWRALLYKARSNLLIQASADYPGVELTSAVSALAPPENQDGVLPLPPEAPAAPSLRERARRKLGKVAGQVVTGALRLTLPVIEKLGVSDDVWTNWYHRPGAFAILTLSYMREQLSRNNLKNTYPDGHLVAFQSRGLVPPAGASHFRTADGSWNNLDNPKEGAAHVRVPRNVARAVTWPRSSAQLLTPNPAEISQRLLARGAADMKEVPFLNLLAAAWIQFNVHDWVSHKATPAFGVHELPLPPDHSARRRYHQTKMFVPVTEPDPTRRHDDDGTPPTYLNEVTAWWDASQIYGSDLRTAQRLRLLRAGKMKLDERGRLPLVKDGGGVEDTGFNRNWWLGLSLLHNLFVREHNILCDMLAKSHPDWDDERLYQVARLINAAVIAKIHTVEWTPAILPNPTLHTAMNANWHGILQTVTREREERSALPWFKLQNPEIGGIVGNPIEKHGVPFGLTEEFTEIYRLHELLPDTLSLRSIHDNSAREVALADVRLAGSRRLVEELELHDLLYSFGTMNPGQLVLNNYPESLRELSIPGNPVYDLGAVDILRARERGVPRYNEFRRQLGLKPIRSFEDLTSNPEQLKTLKEVYENDIEAIDLLVGTRAETQRPTGFGFGETMFQVFILMASRRLQADRFFTDSYNEATYSKEGLAWIDAADLKSVLLRHFPELAETGLMNVENAFEPWDTGTLDPSRHPLRAFRS
jgi:hypothetical protein